MRVGDSSAAQNVSTVICIPGKPFEESTSKAEDFKAASSLLWPIVVLVIAITYKADIRSILKRARSIEIFGQKAELDRDLDRLQATAERAEKEVEQKPLEPNEEPPPQVSEEENVPPSMRSDRPGRRSNGQVIDSILREASTSPKVALISLAGELEQLLRRMVGAQGAVQPLRLLRAIPGIPDSVVSAFQIFWHIRSRLVHGENVTSEELIRAIDSGLTIFKTIAELPNLATIVEMVDLYSDENLINLLDGVRGVVISYITNTQDGAEVQNLLWPTDKVYRAREIVKPAWDTSRSIQTAWYKDPRSDRALRTDWLQAAYFVGESAGRSELTSF
jgi:hypothetical protein